MKAPSYAHTANASGAHAPCAPALLGTQKRAAGWRDLDKERKTSCGSVLERRRARERRRRRAHGRRAWCVGGWQLVSWRLRVCGGGYSRGRGCCLRRRRSARRGPPPSSSPGRRGARAAGSASGALRGEEDGAMACAAADSDSRAALPTARRCTADNLTRTSDSDNRAALPFCLLRPRRCLPCGPFHRLPHTHTRLAPPPSLLPTRVFACVRVRVRACAQSLVLMMPLLILERKGVRVALVHVLMTPPLRHHVVAMARVACVRARARCAPASSPPPRSRSPILLPFPSQSSTPPSTFPSPPPPTPPQAPLPPLRVCFGIVRRFGTGNPTRIILSRQPDSDVVRHRVKAVVPWAWVHTCRACTQSLSPSPARPALSLLPPSPSTPSTIHALSQHSFPPPLPTPPTNPFPPQANRKGGAAV